MERSGGYGGGTIPEKARVWFKLGYGRACMDVENLDLVTLRSTGHELAS